MPRRMAVDQTRGSRWAMSQSACDATLRNAPRSTLRYDQEDHPHAHVVAALFSLVRLLARQAAAEALREPESQQSKLAVFEELATE